MIRNSGVEPQVIEYLKTPPTREQLLALIAASGLSVREVMRSKETLFTELGLADPARSDAELAREYIGQGDLSPKSIANTQKELYRFLTWCREEARKTFQQLTVADLNAYKGAA